MICVAVWKAVVCRKQVKLGKSPLETHFNKSNQLIRQSGSFPGSEIDCDGPDS